MPDVMYAKDDGEATIWARMPDLDLAVIQYNNAISKAPLSGAVKVWIEGEEDDYTWEKPPLPPNVVIMKEAKTRHPPGRLK